MSPKSERYRRLREFFTESFSPEDLEVFLKLNGFEEVAEAVSRSTAGARYFFRVIEELDHRGLIDDRFFGHLEKERPAKTARIQDLVQLWLDQDETGSKPSASTPSSGLPEGIPTETASDRDRSSMTLLEPDAGRDLVAPVAPQSRSIGARSERPLQKWLVYSAIGGAALLVLFLLGYPAVRGRKPDGTKVDRPPPRSSVPIGEKPSTEKTVPPPLDTGPEHLTTCLARIELKRISPNTFWMGSADDKGEPDEHPRHEVRISRAFYLGIYEVTQAQYQAVTGKNPSYFSAWGLGSRRVSDKDTGQYPVEKISWFEAVEFCNLLSLHSEQDCKRPRGHETLKPYYEIDGVAVRGPDWNGTGYRLPTEAEWEYACRAGTTGQYFFSGDASQLRRFAWCCGHSGFDSTHPVSDTRRVRAANLWGLYDMCGNVAEWCWDCYGEYHSRPSPEVDPHGPDPSEPTASRVVRGGDWSSGAEEVRSASRAKVSPLESGSDVGFRVARFLPAR
jgi:formylglycine-generating enzyme required for sulfatase activity